MNFKEISLYEKKSISSFNYFRNFKDFSKIIEHKETFESFEHIHKTSNDTHHLNDIINLALDFEFPRFLVNFLNHLKRKINESTPRIVIDLIYFSLSITNNFSINSKFSLEFQSLNGLETLFGLLEKIPALSRFNNVPFTNIIINSLSQIARRPVLRKWRQENALEIIKKLSEQNDPEIKFSTFVTLAYIIQEDKISKSDLLEISKEIALVILKLVDRLEKNKVIRNNDTKEDELTIKISNTTWTICDLLEALYHLVVNDAIKESIYERNLVEKIILFGNQIEKTYAIKLLWQLCFDSEIAVNFLKNKLLFSLIEEYANNQQIIEELREYAKGCIWTCRNFNRAKNYFTKHIMISYSSDKYNLVKQIKQDLVNEGHKVWLDIDQINGISFESTSRAIEESKCVLMCLSDKSKFCPYSRLDAEFAFGINKPIIPVLLEENFETDGWLKRIIGSNKTISLINYETGIHNLKEEITNTLNLISLARDKKPDKIQDWTEEIVSLWFYEKNFNEILCKYVLPSNGKALCKLYEILKLKPDIFYKSSNPSSLIKDNDLNYFTNEVKKLFEK